MNAHRADGIARSEFLGHLIYRIAWNRLKLELENVLQCKLQNSWICSRGHSAEERTRKISSWVIWLKVIQDVEGFCPEFDSVAFGDSKIPN